jgi:hypothetical protein
MSSSVSSKMHQSAWYQQQQQQQQQQTLPTEVVQ